MAITRMNSSSCNKQTASLQRRKCLRVIRRILNVLKSSVWNYETHSVNLCLMIVEFLILRLQKSSQYEFMVLQTGHQSLGDHLDYCSFQMFILVTETRYWTFSFGQRYIPYLLSEYGFCVDNFNGTLVTLLQRSGDTVALLVSYQNSFSAITRQCLLSSSHKAELLQSTKTLACYSCFLTFL